MFSRDNPPFSYFKELREKLEAAGLATDGLKAVLVERLQAHVDGAARPALPRSWVVFSFSSLPPKLESDILHAKPSARTTHTAAPTLQLPLPPAPRSFNTPVSVAAGRRREAQARWRSSRRAGRGTGTAPTPAHRSIAKPVPRLAHAQQHVFYLEASLN